MALTICLSLLAAALMGIAAVLQQQGTADVSDSQAQSAGFIRVLVARPVWVAGMAADITGFIAQAWALAVGSLLLVQPLLVASLLVALPLGAAFDKRRLRPAEWAWSAVLVVSLVVFVTVGEPTAGIQQPTFKAWAPMLVISIVLVVACMLDVRGVPHGSRRSLLIALAAGILLGVSGPMTKGAVHGFSSGFISGVTNWQLWGMAVTATLGTLWQQSSYQAGDVQTSLPAVSMLKPLVAMVIGLTIYQEHLKVSGWYDALLAAAIAAMVVSTLQLGRLAAPHIGGAGSDGAPDTVR